MLTLDNFETLVPLQIVQRGQAYFRQKAVVELDEDPSGTWRAVVEGSENYEVEVLLSGKQINKISCDCPYDGGSVCKHMVAVLLALREASILPQTASGRAEKKRKLSFEDVLQKVELEELRNFVRHQKAQNREFGDKFLLFFAEKDPDLDVAAKYEGLVRQIIRRHSSRGFMDYQQVYAFSNEISGVELDAKTALAKQNYRDAFAIARVLACEVLGLVQTCDDSSGRVGGVISDAIRIFAKIAESEAASPELCAEMFDFLEKSLPDRDWFDYGDAGYDLVAVAEKLAVRADPERFLKLMDALLQISTGKYDDYRRDHFTRSKIRLLEKIGRTAEVEKLVAQNMDIVEVRRQVVQKAIENGDFVRAKQLIHEGVKIAESKGHPGTVSEWEKMLLDLARATGDVPTIRHFTKKFAFDRGFSVEFFRAWKASFSPDEWGRAVEAQIDKIIAEEDFKPRRFAFDHAGYSLFNRLSPIFIEEKMWQRLLELLPSEPSESILEKVHPHLASLFPAEMLGFYLKLFQKMGEKASDRAAYAHLANLMKKVKRDIAGSHVSVDELVVELIRRHPRRPAMIEELGAVLNVR